MRWFRRPRGWVWHSGRRYVHLQDSRYDRLDTPPLLSLWFRLLRSRFTLSQKALKKQEFEADKGVLKPLEPRANLFGQFLDFFGLPEAADRKHVTIILFQLLLQTLCQLNQLRGVLNRALVVGFQHRLHLRFRDGQSELRWIGGSCGSCCA